MARVASLMLGILVERRESVGAWQEWVWRPAAVIAWSRGNDRWRKLRDDGGLAVFHAGHLRLTLYGDETEAYRQNLERPRPELYVVLRSADPPDAKRPQQPVLVTASPNEAAAYSEAEDGVHPVPMPPAVVAWVHRFVETNLRPAPFVRRSRREREAREAVEKPHRVGIGRQTPAWRIPRTS